VARSEERRQERVDQTRGWIKNVIVPALVDEWLSTHQDHNRIAAPFVAVAKSEPMSPVQIGRMAQ
jgi:hypothetical protein